MTDRDHWASKPHPLTRGGAAPQIIADLKDKILQRILPRGARLPSERELADLYEVSIPTIREAIRGLAAVDLVEVRHGMGAYVTAATDKMMATAAGALIELEDVQLLDVLEILEALYVKAAALACVHASEEELSTILQTLDALEREDGADKLGVSLRKFLGLVADASHNVLVATLCKFLNDLLMRVAQNEIGGVTANWPRIAGRLGEDRRDLMNALLARDVEGAMAAAAAYHRHTRSLVKDAMDAYQGPPGDGLRDAFKRLRQTES